MQGEIEEGEQGKIEEGELGDIAGLLADLEDGLTLSLSAVRKLRAQFDGEQTDEALSILERVASKIEKNREANAVKGHS